jgi:hypothetical protein
MLMFQERRSMIHSFEINKPIRGTGTGSNDLRDSFVVSPAFDALATAALPPMLSFWHRFHFVKEPDTENLLYVKIKIVRDNH